MWRNSDFVRSPNRKTTNDIDLEMITWSWNEVEPKDLIRAHCFPTVVCLSQTLDDDNMRLEAGMILELHGSLKSDLKLLCKSTIENINNYEQQKHNRISRHSSELQRFKSREISTIDEEEETAGTLHDLQEGLRSVKVTRGDEDDDDVLIARTIGSDWLQHGEVLLVPCCLRPKFRLPSKPPKLSESERENTLGMLLRSSGSIDLDECLGNSATKQVESEHLTGVPGHRRTSQNFNIHTSNTTICDVIEGGKSFETLLPNSAGNKKDGVRRMKSMFSLNEGVEAVDGCFENNRSSASSSCANLNRSIISLFSSSNLSLNSNVHGSELLNILRPKNYKRQTSETAPKPKSRFSLFRAKKSKKSKHEKSTEEERSTQSELMKAKRYVDLLDVVGKPKSSDCSVMGSILNLSELGHVVSCTNSVFDLSSTKHLSMPCDIDKIRSGTTFHHPQSFRPLALENYLINKSELPSETSIARKKKMKTNLRMKNKFGSQVLSNDSEDLKRQAVYADDFSKSMENVKCLEVMSPHSETRERPVQRLGISMIKIKVDSEKCTNDLLPKVDVSQSIAHLSIHEPTHQSHPHPIIRTNPHHTNRGRVKKCNVKQYSKSTLSTDDDFQFVRLLSVRKTADNNPSHHHIFTPNNNNNNNNSRNNEVIYENIGFLSDASFHDSLAPVESLDYVNSDSRTNSTESSDYVNSDSSFGGANDHPSFTTSKLGNQQDKRTTRLLRFYDDDGYQSSMDIVEQFSNNSNNSNNCPFSSELVSYL